MRFWDICSLGLAIFAMLFGAGNVVFPLGLGRDTGSMVFFAAAGFILTGVLVPLLGLVASALFDGDYKKFLGKMGKYPGMIIALLCMMLIGPFGATPRCLTLAHSAIKWHVPSLSLFIFSLIAVVLVFFATIKRSYVVQMLGRVLGPIKFLFLFSIVILGFLAPASVCPSSLTASESFFKGIREGYWTLDLLGTMFFSGLIVSSIKARKDHVNSSARQVVIWSLQASIIGGLLLGIIYTGFCLLAAKYGTLVAGIDKDLLLSALASLVLGSKASCLANITVMLACLTTAIALTAVFANYLTHEVFFGRIPYAYALLLTLTLTFAMANLGFAGIAQVIEPIVVLCYPALIVLAVANVAHVLWGFKYVFPVVFSAFAVSVAMYFWQ